jgi:hypothetical protein
LETRFKTALGRLALVLGSTLVALLLCEMTLRLFYPKFRYAAESAYQTSHTRIWSRNPHTRYTRLNPDTGRAHLVCHNNLGLRQHRDFSPTDLTGALNAGFFGDSFVENLRLPVAYSFTEPLDFLLNRSGRRANVLNFGVDGYGTDQAYLTYLESPVRARLADVFYVFCANDVRNIYENQLYQLDAAGSLVLRPARQPSWIIRFIGRFHLTYLVVETVENLIVKEKDLNKRVDLDRFLQHARNYRTRTAVGLQDDFVRQNPSPLLEENIRLMLAILRAWRRDVEATGGRFHVVLLPRLAEHRAAALFTAAGFPVIDLYAAGRPAGAPETERTELFFAKDGHWNERGNQLAATALYGQLAAAHGLNLLDDAGVRRQLSLYYGAFGARRLPDGEPLTATPAPGDAAAIRQKYAALE